MNSGGLRMGVRARRGIRGWGEYLCKLIAVYVKRVLQRDGRPFVWRREEKQAEQTQVCSYVTQNDVTIHEGQSSASFHQRLHRHSYRAALESICIQRKSGEDKHMNNNVDCSCSITFHLLVSFSSARPSVITSKWISLSLDHSCRLKSLRVCVCETQRLICPLTKSLRVCSVWKAVSKLYYSSVFFLA